MLQRFSLSLLISFLLLFTLTTLAQTAKAPNKTLINDEAAKTKLIGTHRLSVQWISWDYFGKVTISDDNGLLRVKGSQKSRNSSDLLTIDGVITQVNAKDFTFNGTIVFQYKDFNKGEPCKREGEMTFKITQNRRYWRLKEMQNPCEEVVDYIDIYFN